MCFRALLGIRFANWEARRRQRKILERLRSGVLGVSLPLPLQPTPGQVFQGQTPPWLPAMVKRELSSGSSVHSRRAKSPTGTSRKAFCAGCQFVTEDGQGSPQCENTAFPHAQSKSLPQQRGRSS